MSEWKIKYMEKLQEDIKKFDEWAVQVEALEDENKALHDLCGEMVDTLEGIKRQGSPPLIFKIREK